ncbi:variable surface protein Vir12-related [Plasmodium vivax]|uniref:Variable surface protein Vir12-related n=1 Tax=Plasmodium vivax (strain Salvador I) TaxID=126793 RepID=A5KCQ4_PLAVS|nr:variable surface protein Vir12-related [Plasmodium vivax]EDL42884.1 variable surface protein Vir12-related [Plasmodium vivax]|eukprot:XP_001612658.1 variable surface protein Vir12-related [Plasmodium vivax Sal-1]
MHIEKYKDILVGTSSKKIYDELNQDVNKNDYDRFCQEFKTDENAENDNFKLCKKIARNAENLSKMGVTDAYRYRCTHYRHWVYDELHNLLKDKKGSSDIQDFINKLIYAQKYIILWYGEYGCHFNFHFKDLEELEEKQEEKRLYDYFQNYSSIKTYDTCNRVELAKYEVYLRDISALYEKYKNKKQCCQNLWWNNCINYFNCHDDYNPKKLLNSLTKRGTQSCDNIKKDDKSLNPPEQKNSQNSEDNIMNKFHYARCKNITKDMMTCNILPINFKSPKNIYKPFQIANCEDKTCTSIPDIHLQPDKLPEFIAPVTDSKEKPIPKFPSKDYTISQSNGDTIIVPKENKYRYVFTFNRPIEEKDASPLEENTKPSIKWMFGKGELNCTDDDASKDKYELCKYVKNLKESQRKLKEQYKGSHELADIMSKFSNTIPQVNGDGSIIHSNPDENTDSEGIIFPDSDDYNIDMSEDENNIFYNILVRIGLVAFLTLGSIFLFFAYYKVNED